MAKFIIDGKNIEAEEGATILDAARENGIGIPTLCTHDEVGTAGACRLCVVEVKKGNRSRIVTSCLYGVEDGIVVDTHSERVMAVRRLVLQLLLARCPASDLIRDLAEEMGVKPEPRFTVDTDKGKCILCRLCVRTCEQVVGVSAIGFSFRGADKTVGTPFHEQSKACIGCGACAYICPSDHIEMTAVHDKRIIWDREFKMASCSVCGRYFAPEDQLEFISKKTGVPMTDLMVCTSCR